MAYFPPAVTRSAREFRPPLACPRAGGSSDYYLKHWQGTPRRQGERISQSRSPPHEPVRVQCSGSRETSGFPVWPSRWAGSLRTSATKEPVRLRCSGSRKTSGFRRGHRVGPEVFTTSATTPKEPVRVQCSESRETSGFPVWPSRNGSKCGRAHSKSSRNGNNLEAIRPEYF
jgi:hypothetical protein